MALGPGLWSYRQRRHGPWLFTVIALTGIANQRGVGQTSLSLVTALATYNFSFSLVFFGPIAMVLPRTLPIASMPAGAKSEDQDMLDLLIFNSIFSHRTATLSITASISNERNQAEVVNGSVTAHWFSIDRGFVDITRPLPSSPKG